MTKLFYQRLAATNIKKHSKIYLPYIIASTITVMMYYIINSLSRDTGLIEMAGGATLEFILELGSKVVAVIAVIVLFYINSFIMKRRTKEFGLFNVLGMEKRHIAIVAGWEVLYVAIISILSGLLLGIILSKLMQLVLIKLVKLTASFDFNISVSSILSTSILFIVFFFCTLLFNLVKVYRSKPTELLSSGNVGEREPRTKWIMTIIGVVCLGIGYYIAITTEAPLEALASFFIAIMLVIVGTYLLFTAVSIAVLKLLRHNKNYYYKPKHFISTSGMIYRMKQNAAGLATICILVTAILIMISTTISLYIGVEDVIHERYPQNIALGASDTSDENIELVDTIINDVLSEQNTKAVNTINYKYLNAVTSDSGNSFNSSQSYSSSGMSILYFIPLDEYNRLESQSVTLASDQILLYSTNDYQTETITVGGTQWKVASVVSVSSTAFSTEPEMGVDTYYLIMPDEASAISACNSIQSDDLQVQNLSYYCGFDLDADSETQKAITYEIQDRINALSIDAYVDGAESSKIGFFTMYGGLLFLGAYLGIMFMIYTVLIIYYKQISEGYDDRERFVIMQNVGMSSDMVKSTIRGQVLSVFFLPLIVAGIHVAAAFKLITRLLEVFYLTNVPLFAICTLCTLVAFAILYSLVYTATAKQYYKIVRV